MNAFVMLLNPTKISSLENNFMNSIGITSRANQYSEIFQYQNTGMIKLTPNSLSHDFICMVMNRATLSVDQILKQEADNIADIVAHFKELRTYFMNSGYNHCIFLGHFHKNSIKFLHQLFHIHFDLDIYFIPYTIEKTKKPSAEYIPMNKAEYFNLDKLSKHIQNSINELAWKENEYNSFLQYLQTN